MNWPFEVVNWHKAHKQSLTPGERAADHVRNGMGSWSFVLLFLFFLGSWAFINTVGGFHHWDKYPFILLNLFLSMLAAIQGSILLIAAKRADALSAAMAKNDYHTNVNTKKAVDELMEINHRQLMIIEELRHELKSAKTKKGTKTHSKT